MENRANYAIVGLFTLAVLAGAFGFVYWFTRAGETGDRTAYRIVFVGSVSGLTKGSIVRFNGIRVGEVTDIELLASDPGKVVATVEVEKSTPMKVDTKARLEYQGLTGVASVTLAGGAGDAAKLVADVPGSKPILFAERSDFQDVLETVQRLSGKIDTVLTRADTLLSQSEGSILSTVKNVEAFSKALADNSSGVSSFLANIGDMSQKVGSLSGRLERFVDQAETIVRAVDTAAINRSISNVAGFTDTLNENRQTVSTLLADAASLTKGLNESAGKLDAALDEITGAVKALDIGRINQTIENVQRFAEALGRNSGLIDSLASRADKVLEQADGLIRAVDPAAVNKSVANIARFSEALGENKDTVSALIADAAQLAKSLNQSAGKLDSALEEVTKLSRSVDVAGLNRTIDGAQKFTDALGRNAGTIDETIREIGRITDKVSQAANRLDNVMAGAEKFLGSGQEGQVSGMMNEIAETAKAIRVLAGNLDKRTGEITAGINRFTGPGLREIEALAADSRKAATDLSRAVRSLERNPQQLLFGGRSNIPEYRQ